MSTAMYDAKMTLENSGFIAAMGKAREASEKSLDIFKTVALGVTGLGGAFAAFRGAEAITEGLHSAFEAGRQLMVQARQASQSVATMVELKRAFEEAGLSADGVNTAIFMLNKALGGVNEEGQSTAAEFNRIGLSIASLKKMNAVDQFKAIIGGLQKLPDAAARANEAQKIFGHGAREVMAILNDPKGFDEAVKNSARYAAIMQQNAPALETVSKAVEAIQMHIQEFYAGVAGGLAPALEEIMGYINRIDFAKWGEDIGKIAIVFTNAFKEGKVGTLLKDTLWVGLAEVINNFAGGLESAIKALGDVIPTLFSSDFWNGLKEGFLGVAEAFTAELMKALPDVFKGLRAISDYFQGALHGESGQQYEKQRQEKELGDYLKSQIAPRTITTKAGKTEEESAKSFNQYIGSLISDKEAGKNTLFTDRQGNVHGLNDVNADGMSFLGKTADQHSADSDTHFDNAKALLKPALDAFTKAWNDAVKNYKPGTVIDTTKVNAELTNLISVLSANAAKQQDQGGGSTSTTNQNNQNSMSYKQPEADRWQKLGLFMGAVPQSPAANAANRTARATEAIQKGIDKLIGITHDSMGQEHEVYARYA